MVWSGSHTVAYVELVQLALQLELLCDCVGAAPLRDALKQDPRDQQVPHLRLQLEVGALAARVGYGVRFERPIEGSKKKADVNIDLPGGESLVVEAAVVLPDERTVAIDRFSEQAFARVHEIEFVYDAHCTGEIIRVLDDDELADVLEAVDTSARLLAIGAVAPVVRLHGATLAVARRGTGTHRGLEGPELGGDLWPRVADRLEKKALQTQGAQNVWLRVCALHGLWLLTEWATKDLDEKLATMRHNILSALLEYPHVDGVVISSSSGWTQGTVLDEDSEHPDGGYAIRRHLPPMMGRETLVVPLNQDTQTISQARIWPDLYGSEPDWLDYALAKFALPTVAQIFQPVGQAGQ
jgi:hypothetical protein